MTDAQIKDRVEARGFATETLRIGFDLTFTDDQRLAFWTEIRDRALEHAPLPEVVAKPKIVPMTERTAEFFEKSLVPYGRHNGLAVQVAMEIDPEWIDWIAGQPDEFKENCKRYLASERGKARLEGRAVTVA